MFGFNLGGGKSSSESQAAQSVWGGQGDALQNMYGQMGGLWNQQQGQMDQLGGMAMGLNPYNQSIMQGQQGGYQNLLGGGSYGDTSDVRNSLMQSLNQTSGGSNMGRMYGDIVGGQGNDYIDPMVESMKTSGMDNLNRMQSGTGMQAAGMGQAGGSRHAMQNAMMGAQANKDMLGIENNMRGGAYDTDLNWKMKIAQQADQGIQSTQDKYMQMLQGANQNVGAGMQAGGNMQNLGMGSMAPQMQSMMMPWNMMGQYSGAMGDPTVLGSSSGSGKSFNVGGGASVL